MRIAGARNNQRAVVKDPSENALVYLDALDLVDVEFDGFAAYETELRDDSLVCDCKLGGLVPYEGNHEEDEPDTPGRQQQNPKKDERSERPEAYVAGIDNLLVLDERAVDVARHPSLPARSYLTLLHTLVLTLPASVDGLM